MTMFNFQTGALSVALILYFGTGVFRPAVLRQGLIAFPRHRLAGQLLTLFNVVWVAVMVYHAPLGRFDAYKPGLFLLAPVAYFAVTRYLFELLAPRMLGGVMLLLASPILHSTRWQPTEWRLVMTVCVYIFIVWGMVLVLTPYRFRHGAEWTFANARRAKLIHGAGLVLGLGLLCLGLFVY